MKGNTEKKPVQSKETEKVIGIISVNSKGTGFVENPANPNGEDFEIPAEHLHTALHRDEVEIIILPEQNRGRQLAKVVRIIKRAKIRFVGVLEDSEKGFAFIADDKRLYVDILIPREDAQNGKAEDKVYIEIVKWDEAIGYPIGKVLEVIGRHGEHNTEMKSIVLDRGLAYDYPVDVIHEAEEIERKEKKITQEEIAKRRDIRKITTFTIDPIDAKDFDDAISVQKLENGRHEIGIHIADVSHYVRPGTALDKEARERGFSVYLVDRTIPMLPEVLSNELCSLNPNEDKLSFSAMFIMDENGRIHERWFGKTIMNSDKRFTYEAAQEIMDAGKGEYHEELILLNTIAKKLRKEKEERGAIDFEQDEIKFELDASGKPLRIIKKSRKDTHKLVEEFMLLANREVAHFMSQAIEKKHGAFLYRIHDAPVLERIENLTVLVRALGYVLPVTKKGVSVKDLKALFKKIEGKAEESLIKTAAIRSMSKAIYSTQNIGHYGLAFEYYTHFTSPIRRYADLIVHRLLQRELTNGPISAGEVSMYQKIATENSEKEIRAAEAERASIKYKQVEYMMDRIGQTFEGTVSGVTQWGIYVEDKATKSEGMVSLRSMTDDYYSLVEKEYAIVGEKTKNRYTLGDSVKFKIVGADLDRKTLDYVIVP
ncbi:MAG: ribonuclease R [Candidatus Taylorbacteria bacterium CG10_big_fil_rev_8_21_14_0_10_41_48]|uniref:Ribonuclease R n=1 Tax=Candidatus Taylorbacteria bacterium CG10_big_fil_rev_8_21_14_0_10_41_48 TaxID=1975024 RepID=A0A2M8LCA1_9BACT|nr:MAG: ribonuclease R [Candidatus Taylorbacteria bacterium CG10_big_fil_rev_8_21_14_0_10_41_48]